MLRPITPARADKYNLRFSRDGRVTIRCQKHLAVPPGAGRGILTILAPRMERVECEGEGVASWLVKSRRNRTVIWLNLDPRDARGVAPIPRRRVQLTYTIRAETVGSLGSLYEFGSHSFPHVRYKWPSELRSDGEPGYESLLPTIVELEWDPQIRCFGPALQPTAGRSVLRLSQAELDDLQIEFGTFTLGLTRDGVHVWVPESDGPAWSPEDLQQVATWAVRVRVLFTELFGAPSQIPHHIIAIPRSLLNTAGRLRGQYFGSAVRITDPRPATSEWTEVATARLATQLSHEISHAWWIPVTLPWLDDRAWALAEAAATASEHLVLGRFFTAKIARQELDREAAFHAVYLTKRFDDHRRLYPRAAAGLRTGYFLSSLIADQGSVVLGALRRLREALTASEPNSRSLDALFENALGAPLAQHLLNVLTQTRPPIAVVRFRRTDQTAGVSFSIRLTTRKSAARLHEQLCATKLCREDIEEAVLKGRDVTVFLKPGRDASPLLSLLSPGFLAYKWGLQADRRSRSGVLAAIWREGNRLLDSTAAGSSKRLLRAALGVILMAAFSEFPQGYRLTAGALAGSSGLLARRLNQAAAARGG